MKTPPDLAAHKSTRSDGSWETYWRAGFVADGQPPILIESYCRREEEALKAAEKAAEEHYEALKDVGVFLEVKAFVQRWKTRSRGNLEEFEEAAYSKRIVLRPDDFMRGDVIEAIERGRQKREPDLRSMNA